MKAVYLILCFLSTVIIAFYANGRINALASNISIERINTKGSTPMTDVVTVATYNIAHARGSVPGRSNWDGSLEQKKRH